MKEIRKAASKEGAAEHVNLAYEETPSVPHKTMDFTNEEAKLVVHLHNDAIVRKAYVANNLVKIVLIDNDSSADVLYSRPP